jgi:gluconokinase
VDAILAVDIGTTSTKALLVSRKGEVLARAQEFYPTHHPQPDFSEQDPEQIFLAVKNVVVTVAEQTGAAVAAVSFSSAMHSLMAVDVNGSPLTPLITWADLRSKMEAAEIKNSGDQKIYLETGTPIHPMSPLCKILWITKNCPEIFTKTYKFIGIKEFVWHRLFGQYTIDHSLASATGLFDASSLSWSSSALAAAGISEQKLSDPCSVYSKFAEADDPSFRRLGLSNIPWIIGASDGCLANLGSGAMEEDTLSLTVGTSGAVRKRTAKIIPDAQGRTFHYLLDEKNIITGGATNNGAVVVQWFSEKFLRQPVDIKSFGEQAGTVTAGSEGLLFLLYLFGERAPVFDPASSGVFFGVRQQHTKEHFMRAVLEGIGFALFSIAAIVTKNSGPSRRIKASGAFVTSPQWVQIMSNIFGKEIQVQGSDDASTLGAAMLGFRALNVETGFQFPAEKIFYPDLSVHALYLEYFSVYQTLHPQLASSFKALHQIANR